MGVGQSRRKKKKRGARILMLGLDSAGKTTLLYRMMTESVVSTIPTVGFNVEEIFHSETKFSLNIWDIGGDANIRQLWRHYFLGSKGLIYVLDSSDHERLDLAKREFREVIMSREMSECSVVLVFANKQDAKNALSPKKIPAILGLDQLKAVDWRVQPSVGTKGIGIYEGFKWLLETTMSAREREKNERKREKRKISLSGTSSNYL